MRLTMIKNKMYNEILNLLVQSTFAVAYKNENMTAVEVLNRERLAVECYNTNPRFYAFIETQADYIFNIIDKYTIMKCPEDVDKYNENLEFKRIEAMKIMKEYCQG
jgi:hypothetical protein